MLICMQSTSVRIDATTHAELKRLATELDTTVGIESHPANGLRVTSAAQCQHVRAVSPSRIVGIQGNVGAALLAQVRETIAVIVDLP